MNLDPTPTATELADLRALSQERLADRAGISLATVARLDLLTELRDVAAAQKADRSGPGAATLTRMS